MRMFGVPRIAASLAIVPLSLIINFEKDSKSLVSIEKPGSIWTSRYVISFRTSGRDLFIMKAYLNGLTPLIIS